MYKSIITFAVMILVASAAWATEFQVAVSGSDANPGTQRAPFRTIQQAAELAQPGDVILFKGSRGVHVERALEEFLSKAGN